MVNIVSQSDYYSTCPVSLIINSLNQYCYQMTVGDGYFAVSDQITSTDISLMVIRHSWDNTLYWLVTAVYHITVILCVAQHRIDKT